MLPDASCVSQDAYGCPTVKIRAEHLEDFPAFVSWINEQGYGRSDGFLKLCLHPEDRKDAHIMEKAVALLKKAFKLKTFDSKQKKMVSSYNPDIQTFSKGSLHHHIYEYIKCECSAKERQQFVHEALNLSSYISKEKNCCTEILQSPDHDLDALRCHLFNAVDQVSTYNDVVKQNLEELGAEFQNKVQGGSFVYGAGIQVDTNNPIKICREFSLSSLNTIIDDLEEKYDGIAYPYVYVGSKHTVFPWHIEDGGLYSINYHMGGMPKIWFVIPPQYYGVVDVITSCLQMSLAHTSCRAVLADHKAAVIDPSFLSTAHGQIQVPFKMVVQELGDFIVTFPFALHSGANLGHNLAIAANFADVDWIELGMYAPICSCLDNQIHFRLTNLMRLYRPDLLNTYLTSPCLLPPPGHPRDVVQFTTVKCVSNPASTINEIDGKSRTVPLRDETSADVSTELPHKRNSRLENRVVSSALRNSDIGREKSVKKAVNRDVRKVNVVSRKFYCPGCSQSFVDKLNRLREHIMKMHNKDADNLLRIIESKYVKAPRTALMFMCKVCEKTFRGSSTHVKHHHLREHPNVPYEAPVKA